MGETLRLTVVLDDHIALVRPCAYREVVLIYRPVDASELARQLPLVIRILAHSVPLLARRQPRLELNRVSPIQPRQHFKELT